MLEVFPETTKAASIADAKTKGKERIRDTGLQDVPDAEVKRRARDKSLSPSERQRYKKGGNGTWF